MSLKVIGAGWSRTGTFSLRLALQQLGLGPCYHMHEVFSHPEHAVLWRRAAAGELESWGALLGEYQSVADAPACLFWRELMRAHPDAKVVLTVRDPGTWYESMCSTVYPVILAASEGVKCRPSACWCTKSQRAGGRCVDFCRCPRPRLHSPGPMIAPGFDAARGWTADV